MATRSEVIYQSIALFSSNVTGDSTEGVPSGSVTALQRVTDIDWGGEVTRQDINCMGKLAATSREIIEEPTVNLSFSYYLANGFNENAMGLAVRDYGHSTDVNIISGVLADAFGSSEKNYYVLTVNQGEDASNVSTDPITTDNTGYGVIGIGNAFMSDYTVNLAVGDIPNASVTFDAANLTFSTLGGYTDNLYYTGFQNPAIKRAESTDLSDLQFSGVVNLPKFISAPAASGVHGDPLSVAALRPGDVVVNFAAAPMPAGGAILPGNTLADTKQSAHVQSVSIGVPLSRTPLTRLGNPFAFARKIDVPINTTITVAANIGDITTGSLVNLLCSDDLGRDISIILGQKCGEANNMRYDIKGAQLDSQSMSINIGDSETVDLTFTAQIGGYNDVDDGVFVSGFRQSA
tara:strand:+ start:2547 stop:3761 length:1215 start_codon:yes stop_codon:yes gene_type:complete